MIKGGGDNWRYKTSKTQVKTVTTNKATANLLQAMCPVAKPTMSEC